MAGELLFAHNSLGFAVLLRFCDVQSGVLSIYLTRCTGPLARTWRRPFPSCGVASPAILRWGLFAVLWKRSLVKLNANNRRPIAHSRWWFKGILPVSSGRLLPLLALAAVVCPGHRFETSPRDRLIAGIANSVRAMSDPSQGHLDGL